MPAVPRLGVSDSRKGSPGSLFSWVGGCAPGGAWKACRGGFTLIELVVVLAVTATLAVTIVPRLSNENLLVAAQADRLANDLRYVQSLAMTQGQRYVLDLGSGPPYTGYSLKTASGVAVRHPASGLTTALAFDGAVTASGTTNLSAGLIGFDGRGVPYTNSPFSLLTVGATITLDSNGRQRSVSIAPQTGRIAQQ
jgi:prepilin-type N-terminal cleavage/methylation domain-containing protein